MTLGRLAELVAEAQSERVRKQRVAEKVTVRRRE
jgi:cation transport ATPase